MLLVEADDAHRVPQLDAADVRSMLRVKANDASRMLWFGPDDAK